VVKKDECVSKKDGKVYFDFLFLDEKHVKKGTITAVAFGTHGRNLFSQIEVCSIRNHKCL
jgi:hypothetical protein